MKILFLVPPLNTDKGYPTLGGNRQFQYFRDPTFTYPLVPAQIATQLSKTEDVEWIDCLAQGVPLPDLDKYDQIYVEVKQETYKETVQILHKHLSKVILFGDYAYSQGGDPIDYDRLGFEIDRDLTKWWLYSTRNGNYRSLPGTYIMSARDCWWGQCTFCSWQQMYKGYKVRPVEDVLDEIEMLVVKYGVRDIMDDSGTFPTGQWLVDFCKGMCKRNLTRYVEISCNMRFGVLTPVIYKMMAKSGFRMLLMGIESANQRTLERIRKGIDISKVAGELSWIKNAGLRPHVTCMVGYPWETPAEMHNTIQYVTILLRKGLAWSAQCSIVQPYRGTKIAKDNVFVSKKVVEMAQKDIYNTSFEFLFIVNKLLSIKDLDDIKYYWRIFKKVWRRFR